MLDLHRNESNSGEHRTKRSDLPAVLGEPTQDKPFYFHDLERRNKPIGSLNAKILKAPIRICAECNTTHTQPHDRAWEQMSDTLNRRLVIGQWVRNNRIFRHDTGRRMTNVHLFFLTLFGWKLCEAKANGQEVPIDIAPFSQAIMTGRPHPEVHLQFGRCDGAVGRSNLHCWKAEHGSGLAGWLYELDTIAIRRSRRPSGSTGSIFGTRASSKRFQIADFMYARRVAADSKFKASAGQKPDGDEPILS